MAVLWLGAFAAITLAPAQAADLKLPGTLAADMAAPRQCVCTREYRPVCGRTAEGVEKTFPNACTARCAGVAATRPGKC